MVDELFNEAQAAAELRGACSERTLRRWRKAGLVPYCRTPGGRVRYTFEQIVEIGAAMRIGAIGRKWPDVAAEGRDWPDMSGELRDAAE